MSTLQTSSHTPNAISLQALVSGATPFDEPDGVMTDLFGQVPVRANLSARQAQELGLMTSGTYGRTSSTSSSRAALQSSLESRLRQQSQSLGSTLDTLTWKQWVTPSGVSRFRLRALAPRTSETGRTGWPTPTTRDWKDGACAGANVTLNALLGRVVWLYGDGTASSGSLNPEFSRWLMGLPPEWDACAPMATPSTRKQRKSLSKQP